MSKVILPGINMADEDLQAPSKELLALHQIAVNQVGIADILKQIARMLEIQLRIQTNTDSRNHWKQRFLEAERLNAEMNDSIIQDSPEEGEDDYLQEYQSIQEGEDPDREAKRRGGYPPEKSSAEAREED